MNQHQGFLNNPYGYIDISLRIIRNLNHKSLESLKNTNKYWMKFINSYLETVVLTKFKERWNYTNCFLSDNKILEILLGLDITDKEISSLIMDNLNINTQIVIRYNKQVVLLIFNSYTFLSHEKWFLNGNSHRLDGPSESEWFHLGQIKAQRWNENDKRHRLEGPSEIEWYDNGQIKAQRWSENDKMHRLEGPASTTFYANGRKQIEYWISYNITHRLGGPAITTFYENGQIEKEYWYEHGIHIKNSQIESKYCIPSSF